MRIPLAALVAALLALSAALAAAKPSVSTYELGAKVVGWAFDGSRLVLAFSNGTLAAYVMPHFEPAARAHISGLDALVGMGSLEGGALALAFSNGTIAYLEPSTLGVVGREAVSVRGSLYRAHVRGRWVVLVSKYDFAAEGGVVKLDRLDVYDTKLRAPVLTMERKNSLLVYVFDVKISGSLMLVTWIDTTCKICELDDVFVTVFNLSSYERVFIKRFGGCAADLEGGVAVAVRVKDGRGLYVDLRSGKTYEFQVSGRPLQVRVVGGFGYVLTQSPDGSVLLYRVRGSEVTQLLRLEGGERGYALLLLNGSVGIASPSCITSGGQSLEVAPYPVPWPPRVVADGGDYAAVLYGYSLLSVLGSPRLSVRLLVRTEPGATVAVEGLNATAVADSEGNATLSVPPGTYRVSAWKEGFERNETTVRVTPPFVEVTLKLRRAALVPRPPNGTSVVPPSANQSSLDGRSVTERNPAPYSGALGGSNATPVTGGRAAELNVSRLVDALGALTQLRRQPPSRPPSLPTVYDLRGRPIHLDKGLKLVVFFYTKCAGCSLIVSALKNISGLEVVMVAPSTLDDETSLSAYARGVNASGWAWVLDGSRGLIDTFNVTAFPTLVLLNNGRVEFIGVGAAEEAGWLAESVLWRLEQLAGLLRDPAVGAALIGVALLLLSRRLEREV